MPEVSEEDPPRLRTLAVEPVRGASPAERGPAAPAVVLRDPLGLAGSHPDHRVELDAATWGVARLFDGSRSESELALQLAAESALEPQQATELVATARASLSRRLLLRDETFEDRLDAALTEFRALSVRPPVNAGAEYPGDAIDLRILVGGIVADDWDLPPVAAPHALWLPSTGFDKLRGLYSRGYAALRHAQNVRRVVLLAALDAPSERALIPLGRASSTPLGVVPADREGLSALAQMPGPEELAHRWSPVIERHLPFLQLLFPRAAVLPALVGSLNGDPDSRADAADALARLLALPGPTVLVLAGDVSRTHPGESSALDSELVEVALERDTESLLEKLGQAGHPSHAAGLAPLVLGLEALAAAEVETSGVRLGSERVLVGGEARVGVSLLYR